MPRKPFFPTDEFPYHVSARTNNREFFRLPMNECWEVFAQQLDKASASLGARIHLFLLMSNHFHMLISTPYANLDHIMRDSLTSISRTMSSKIGRINHLFGGPYRWSIIKTDEYLAHVFKYVCRNPIRASICDEVETYPFSTFFADSEDLKEIPTRPLPIQDCYLPPERGSLLQWLNTPTNPEIDRALKQGLRRTSFQVSYNFRRNPNFREILRSNLPKTTHRNVIG